MRIRFALALMVAGLLCAAGVASAQQTTTDPTSNYQSTETTPATVITPKPKPQTTKAKPAPTVQAETQSGVAPSVAAQPAASAPQSLAFTGAEPLLLIFGGLVLAGGTATLLVRDRRRVHQDR